MGCCWNNDVWWSWTKTGWLPKSFSFYVLSDYGVSLSDLVCVWKRMSQYMIELTVFKKKMFFYKRATPTHRNAWLHSNSSQYAIIFPHTAQKMEFSIKDFLSKCDQIRRKLPIWSNLLKKLLMENFIFSAVPIISQCRLFF